MKSAVLYCVFNRLDTVEKTFAAIKAAKPPRLYINSDGPRPDKQGEAQMVQEVRRYILDNIDWECDVKTRFLDENVGLKRAIRGGVDWLFENEEMGIILEDDILCGKSFFDFCDKMLEKYKDNEKVRSICPLAPDCAQKSDLDYRFSSYSNIWGWATWRRVWKTIDFDTEKLVKKADFGTLKEIIKNENEALKWEFTFKRFQYDYGALTWAYTYIINNFFAAKNGCYSILMTNTRLCTNIGFEGEHYDKKSCAKLGIDVENLKEPNAVELDIEYIKKCELNKLEPEIEKYQKMNIFHKFLKKMNLYFHILRCYLKMSVALNSKARRRRWGRLLEAGYDLKCYNLVKKYALETSL